MSEASDYQFSYLTTNVGKLGLELTDNSRKSRTIYGGKSIKSVIVDGEPIVPSSRFWESFYSRFGINTSFFKFFSCEEVFKQIADHEKDASIRVTVEKNVATGSKQLLAISNPNKGMLLYDDFLEVVNKFVDDDSPPISYHNGILSSNHGPRTNNSEFEIGGDLFKNRFTVQNPVDGYGAPNIYLSMLRMICSNGAVGLAKAFRTSLSLGSGENMTFALQRALDSFTNDEGYSLLRNRIETATQSWASVKERESLYRLLIKLQNDTKLKESISTWTKTSPSDMEGGVANVLLKAFDRYTGNPYEMYKIDPTSYFGERRQRSLKVNCKVYDLINFATELSTHHLTEANARTIQGWVGSTLGEEFDLEDSAVGSSEWRDLFLEK